MNDRFVRIGAQWAIAASLGLAAANLPVTASALAEPADRGLNHFETANLETNDRDTEYWHTARRLLAERLYILIATREALLQPDPDAIADVDLDLYENQLKTQRFLRHYGTALNVGDRPGCGSAPAIRDDRLQVYCALATTQLSVEALFEPLQVQQDAIADLPPSSFLPGAVAIGTPGEPDRALMDDEPTDAFDAATPLPGVTAKPPLARTTRRVVPPAYSPPPELLDRLDAIVSPLLEARAVLPVAFTIALPDDSPTGDRAGAPVAAATFAPPAQTTAERDRVPQPTGYIPSATPDPNRNPTDNRVLADAPYSPIVSGVSAVPFATVPGLPNAIVDEFVPSLLLEIAGDRLEVATVGFDFGTIADLGATGSEIDLDTLTLDAAIARLDPALRSAFTDYRPPETFAELHADRQRVWTGKNGALGVAAGVTTSQPAIADRVYLFRTIQYDLPEFIETGRALYPSERRNLNRALATPSFDATIAVQLLEATDDGGYLIRWRLLERFADPQIVDLYNYANDLTGNTAR